jgi:hypothetical protein
VRLPVTPHSLESNVDPKDTLALLLEIQKNDDLYASKLCIVDVARCCSNWFVQTSLLKTWTPCRKKCGLIGLIDVQSELTLVDLFWQVCSEADPWRENHCARRGLHLLRYAWLPPNVQLILLFVVAAIVLSGGLNVVVGEKVTVTLRPGQLVGTSCLPRFLIHIS